MEGIGIWIIQIQSSTSFTLVCKYLVFHYICVVVVVIVLFGLQLQEGIDGGGRTLIQLFGAYNGAPHFGHEPTCVYMFMPLFELHC